MNWKSVVKKNRIYQLAYEQHWRERGISRGRDYPDLTFYVIRRHANRAGLFSFVMTNLGSIKYATDHGYIPVIDMQNSLNPMMRPEDLGKVNSWEYYFKQPAGYNLTDIKHAKNIILSSITPPALFPGYEMLDQPDELKMWRELAALYLHPVAEVDKKADGWIFAHGGSDRMLGVLCRGTDYIAMHPHDHPVQPDVAAVITKCNELMSKSKKDYIYLATEDQSVYKEFEKKFPGRVISFQKNRVVTEGNENINDAMNKQEDPVERNIEYLISIRILSKIPYFLAGATNGSFGAVIMGAGSEYCHIWQLGKYC